MEDRPAMNLTDDAIKATKEIFQCYMNNFQAPEKDCSYKRAMFRQGRDEYAGNCTMVIDVEIVAGDDSAHIVTKFGDKS